MTIQFIYVKSEEANWGNALAVAHKYNELFKNNKIIKNGGYYARLADTKKRGFKAYEELIKTEFSDTNLNPEYFQSFMGMLMKCKTPPEVEINSLVFNKEDWIKAKVARLEFQESEEPFDLPIQDISPEISEEDKINAVMCVVDSFDFTFPQIVKLMSKLMDKLLELNIN
tara:strand:- start:318 stop:827 length:510 start_codon:yes stop_codon:yes gene_type:complete